MRRKQTWGDRNQSSEIDYIEKNLDVIAYVELAFKRKNPICDVTCCRLSDKRFQNLSSFGIKSKANKLLHNYPIENIV